jgi:hypothetical protein
MIVPVTTCGLAAGGCGYVTWLGPALLSFGQFGDGLLEITLNIFHVEGLAADAQGVERIHHHGELVGVRLRERGAHASDLRGRHLRHLLVLPEKPLLPISSST